jgi:restriction system protein
MTGERFEEWLANFFRARGYSVKLTPRTGDYGVDLDMRKDGKVTVVQAKRWKGNVGPRRSRKSTLAKLTMGRVLLLS